MNQQQAKNLKTLRATLLALPPREAAEFNIHRCDKCAWGIVLAKQVVFQNETFKDFDDSPAFFGHAGEGEDYGADETDYLFQDNADNPWRYDSPTGRAGIEEFANRVENVLQFYGHGA